MHLIMMLVAIGLSWWLRTRWSESQGNWRRRWQRSLFAFLFSPLLLLSSAVAILCMGPQGQMVRWWEGWGSYGLAIGFLSIAGSMWLKLVWEGSQTLQRIIDYPAIDLNGISGRVLDTPLLYSAQIGFWHPELVISRGLLATLDSDHLEAVLIHEQAHRHYRDTFWFFWLGWLRRITFWLPQTDRLWQDLLMLRELRADQWAAQFVDSLLLAESLLLVVKTPTVLPEFGAAFSSAAPPQRLIQRIEALLSDAEPVDPPSLRSWLWLLPTLLPLVVIPFHQ